MDLDPKELAVWGEEALEAAQLAQQLHALREAGVALSVRSTDLLAIDDAEVRARDQMCIWIRPPPTGREGSK